MATIEDATLILRLPESSLPRKDTWPSASSKRLTKILVAGNHHHDDEARHQRGVDEAEDGQDHIGFIIDERVDCDLVEFVDERNGVDGE